MKHIRELRIGPPKSFKTGAIAGTYPKPMLFFQFDVGGLDVIPSATSVPAKDRVVLDVVAGDIVWIAPADLPTWCKKPESEQPKILAVDFTGTQKRQMTEKFVPIADSLPYIQFYNAVNAIMNVGAPWKTFVLDSVTSLCEALLQHVASSQGSWLSDARKWAPAIGGKVNQHIAVITSLPIHCVFIAHSRETENEKTSEIKVLPMIPSRFAEQIGGVVSQYFYATMESGKPEVWTKPRGLVKAIGCRWPDNLPPVVGADFTSIYGKELV